MLKERPILFSAPMVRALLAGTKTQTRRVVRMPDPYEWSFDKLCTPIDGFSKHHIGRFGALFKAPEYRWVAPDHPFHGFAPCPYGQPGDRLWVRESWSPDPPCDGTWGYTAWAGCRDGQIAGVPERFRHPRHCLYAATWEHDPLRWTPSIHMPRWASRITLEITGVRVERLQDISEEDSIAEGIEVLHASGLWPERYLVPASGREPAAWAPQAKIAYRELWEQINGEGSWEKNPWVWVVTFRRLEEHHGST